MVPPLLVEVGVAGGSIVSTSLVITAVVAWGRTMPEHAYFLVLFMPPTMLTLALLGHCIRLIIRYFAYPKGTRDPQGLDMPINQLYFKSWLPPVSGLLVSTNYVLISMGSPHVRGALQAIFSLTFVPFALLLSAVLLGHRPVTLQVVGACVVTSGAVISMVPDFKHAPCSASISEFEQKCYAVGLPESHNGSESFCFRRHHEGKEPAWNYLYLLSVPVLCANMVLREFFIKKRKLLRNPLLSVEPDSTTSLLDRDSLQSGGRETIDGEVIGEWNILLGLAASGFFGMIWVSMLFWINVVPGVIPTCRGVGHSLHDFAENMQVAARCVFEHHGGYGNLPDNVTSNMSAPLHHPDLCAHSLLTFMVWQISVFFGLLLMVYLVKAHSATFAVAVCSVGPVLSVFMQISPVLSFGYQHHLKADVTKYSFSGLFVVLLGIVIYKLPSVPVIAQRYPRLAAREPVQEKSLLNIWFDKRLFLLAQSRLDRENLVQEGSQGLQDLSVSVSSHA